MTHFIALKIITILVMLIVPVLAQDERKNEVMVKGEVIDLACFITNKDAGKGPDHKECAIRCAKSGILCVKVDYDHNPPLTAAIILAFLHQLN